MENNFKKGWVVIPFTELLDIQGGTQPPKNTFKYEPTKGYIRLLQIRDFGEKPLPTYIQNKSQLKTCAEGDILIARYGASIGRIVTGMEGAYNVALAKVIIPDPIVKNFIKYLLKSEVFQRPILSIQRSAQDGFNKDDLADIEIPIPPLPEQHRIVAKLDAVMQKVESNKQRLDKIPKLLKRFRQSVLAAAVSGKLTEEWRENKAYNIETDLPLNWKLQKIEKLVNSTKTDLRTGPFGTALKKSEHKTIGIPVWGIESIGENGLFTSYNKIFVTTEKAKELKSFEVKGGNIIISRSGTVGEICILPDDVQYGLISTNLMKIVLNNDIILSKYFCWLFDGSQMVIDKLRELCTGSTRLFLTQTILKEIDYPLPPKEEQIEIIRRVEQLFAFADKIEARYTKAKTMLDKLPQSILAKAFQGELVAQDPNDEPASVLLQRIKAEKEKLVAEKKNLRQAQDKGKKIKGYSIEETPSKIAAEKKVKYKKV